MQLKVTEPKELGKYGRMRREFLEEPQADDLQRHDSGRDSVPASVGNSGDSNSLEWSR